MPTFLMPKASCKETGQTVLSNDISKRFTIAQRADAALEANRLAEQMTNRTGRKWTGRVDEYTVTDSNKTRL